jgi:hypothetical protein
MIANILKFLKIYAVFMVFVLVVNLSMEVFIPTPEEKNVIAIIIFYLIFNLFGSLIFFLKSYKPEIMGGLSFVIGFVLEFAFMRPDWVNKIYALEISIGIFIAVVISAIYWIIAWGIPAYVLDRIRKRKIKKGSEKMQGF